MATKIVEGRKAPDFTLEDATGRRVSLADFKGRDVIVYFYPKDDTPGCTKEACGFRDAWRELQAAGVAVLGISADPAASHAKFAAKYRLPFPLLSDPDRKVMEAWGAYGEKVLYGKKTRGVIRSTVWLGPDGTVRKRWARVADAARHPAQVLEAVRGTRG
jgi:peroxiredoxin Q/BCP